MRMKNLILLIILILFFTLPIFAQRIEISREDFLQRYKLMLAKTESQPRRISSKFEHWITDGKIKFEPQESVIEILPPNKIHNYTKFSDRVFETIYIGDTEYKKEKSVWEERKFVKEQITKMLITLAPEKPGQVRWFLTQNLNVNGQFTNLIEWIFTEEFQFQNKNTNLPETRKISLEIRYWINRENLLARSERIDLNDSSDANNFKWFREYVYDNDIKIAAPIK